MVAVKPAHLAGALCLAITLLSPGFTHRAEAFQAYTHTALTDSVDAMFERWDTDDSPGFALGIFKDGRIIYARGYGMANLEYNIPNTPQTVFRIGSLSKQFTAMCVALLAEQGKLSLDDDIRKFFPEMPEHETPITVRHLVHHTSGIRDYLTLQGLLVRGEYYSSEDALAVLLRQKGLNFTPGERFSYANSGYFLLAALIERASGMKTSEYAREHIFEPLGMDDTHFHDDLNVIVRNRASGYRPTEEGGYRINMTQLDIIGDGSVYTTIEDFFKWDQNFYHNELGNGTQDLMDMVLTKGVLNNGEEITYAFGLDIEKHRGLKIVSHTGSWVGFNTIGIRYPDQRFSVVVFSNGSMGPGRFARRIVDLYLADQFTEPAPPEQETQPRRQREAQERPEPVTLSSSQLQEYAGFYYSDELDAYAILNVEEGALVMKLGMHTATLSAFPPDAFEWRGDRLEFVRDSGRTITGFILGAGRNLSLEFKRAR
ncbi:serine hydrolase domain-containing protein [Gemmatimonadota bacterium]